MSAIRIYENRSMVLCLTLLTDCTAREHFYLTSCHKVLSAWFVSPQTIVLEVLLYWDQKCHKD